MARKTNKPTKTDEDDLLAGTTSMSLGSSTPPPPLMDSTPTLPTRSATEPPLPTSPVNTHPPYTHPDPSAYHSLGSSDPTLYPPSTPSGPSSYAPYPPSDPPPYSQHAATHPSSSSSLADTASTSSPSNKPSKTRKHLNTLKTAVEDGRATSFAKAAYSGGMKAQSSFVKAEMVTHAVKTGNTPLVAINAARAVYKGSKEAAKTWKGAEEERKERLMREGKMDEDGKMIRADTEYDNEKREKEEITKSRKDEKALAKAKAEEEKAVAKAKAKKKGKEGKEAGEI